MLKKVSILGSVMIFAFVLLLHGLPVTAKDTSITLSDDRFMASVREAGETNSRLELNIITDQEQIRKELEAIGIDYDQAIDDLQAQITGPGGH